VLYCQKYTHTAFSAILPTEKELKGVKREEQRRVSTDVMSFKRRSSVRLLLSVIYYLPKNIP